MRDFNRRINMFPILWFLTFCIERSQDRPKTFLPIMVLYQELTPRGTALFIGKEGDDPAISVFEINSRGTHRIRLLQDISHVDLTDTTRALQYVRLTTSPAIAGLLSHDFEAEITGRNGVSGTYMFGDEVLGLKILRSDEGYWGVISDDLYKEAKLRVAVSETDFGYRITRPVLVRSFASHWLPCIATEEVTRSGGYRVTSITGIESARLGRVDWVIP